MADRWHELERAIRAAVLKASDKAVFLSRLRSSTYESAELPAKFTRKQEEVAREIGMTVRQVRRAERHLEQHGWLKISGTAVRGRPHSYVLEIGRDCDCPGRAHDPRKADTGWPVKADTGPARKADTDAHKADTGPARKADTRRPVKADIGAVKADMMSAFTGLKADIMSGERRTPKADTSQVRGQFSEEVIRGTKGRGVVLGEPQQNDPGLRSGDPVSCVHCGADGVVGERLVVHDPGCQWLASLDLYDRER